LIFDDKKRLLVGRGEEDSEGWEMPGGGWEHDESIEKCLHREIEEELGIEEAYVGEPLFVYRGRSTRGWMILRIAVPVKLKSTDFKYGEMHEAKFVTKEEFARLDFAAEEGTIKTMAHKIWPPVG
jgi:ADP-ribose pyrophosphatase YjhB (NUDIX family)